MLREHDRKTAEHFGILARIELLRTDLMEIEGVVDVDFDLDGFWSDIHQVIFLTKYLLPLDDYYTARNTMIRSILECAQCHGLSRTGDRIEDYGEHLYFVTDCPWIKRNPARKMPTTKTCCKV